MKKLYVAKTSRRKGFHKLELPKVPKTKLIGKTMGSIKVPKLKMPQYGC